MDITNISSDTFVLMGGKVLSPDNTIFISDSEYGDERIRDEINNLYFDGKISISNQPTGFPVDDSLLVESPVIIKGRDSKGNNILLIEAPEGYHQGPGDGYLLHIFSGDGTDILNFDPSGALYITSSAEETTPSLISLNRGDNPVGEATIIRSSGGAFDRILCEHNGRGIFRVLSDGAILTASNSAPADNALLAGEMAIWFDDTNGASKLMIKAKQANGTVKTGSINVQT